MVGLRRLDNVRDLIKAVILNAVEGDYIETGVWRGGASIFARAVIAAYGEQASRTSYVCDSFSGLPPGDRDLDPGDKNWDNTTYLEVIIDDWFGFPARTACEDFFKVHGINPNIIAIDNLAVFWMKTEEVTVQHWRYEQSKFKHDQGP